MNDTDTVSEAENDGLHIFNLDEEPAQDHDGLRRYECVVAPLAETIPVNVWANDAASAMECAKQEATTKFGWKPDAVVVMIVSDAE